MMCSCVWCSAVAACFLQLLWRGRLPTCTVPATTQGTWQQYATLPDTSGPAPAGGLALVPPPFLPFASLLPPLPPAAALAPPLLPTGCSSPSSAANIDDFPAPT